MPLLFSDCCLRNGSDRTAVEPTIEVNTQADREALTTSNKAKTLFVKPEFSPSSANVVVPFPANHHRYRSFPIPENRHDNYAPLRGNTSAPK